MTFQRSNFHNSEYRSYSKQIIKNASGFVDQGDALYIMGPSGAGKTSLLNLLSDQTERKKNASFEGDIMINDRMDKYCIKTGMDGIIKFDFIIFSLKCLYFNLSTIPYASCNTSDKHANQTYHR